MREWGLVVAVLTLTGAGIVGALHLTHPDVQAARAANAQGFRGRVELVLRALGRGLAWVLIAGAYGALFGAFVNSLS
jgi:hypothetical protein